MRKIVIGSLVFSGRIYTNARQLVCCDVYGFSTVRCEDIYIETKDMKIQFYLQDIRATRLHFDFDYQL